MTAALGAPRETTLANLDHSGFFSDFWARCASFSACFRRLAREVARRVLQAGSASEMCVQMCERVEELGGIEARAVLRKAATLLQVVKQLCAVWVVS